MSVHMMRILDKKEFLKNKIAITNHAFERWNDRVDNVKTKKEIENIIIQAAKRKGNRIENMDREYYCVDGDIVCCIAHNEKKKVITLITVYGRISENPALNNIRGLLKGIHKYGKVALGRN